MRHLHFDCFSGISGDMVLGALVDVGVPIKELVRGLRGLPLRGVAVTSRRVLRNGLAATKVDVQVRRGMDRPLPVSRIQRLIASSRLPPSVKDASRDVFARLAKAEGRVHRRRPDRVHFHEVGVVDSVVDVVGALLGCHLLGVERVTSSSVNLGAGMIPSAHGSLPVPGPAVAALAKGVPVFAAGPARELTTPTGMAVLRTLTQEFGAVPLMTVTAVGYGAGDADPAGWPNVLRVFLGESDHAGMGETDSIVQVETNLDDLNPQAYDAVMDRLFAAGALDVTLAPVIMKRGRPGIILTALAPRERADAVSGVMLRETTALGVRLQEVTRRVLPRRFITVHVAGGAVRVKVAQTGPGTARGAPEYRDCRRIADRTGRPVQEIMQEAMQAFARHGNMKHPKRKKKTT